MSDITGLAPRWLVPKNDQWATVPTRSQNCNKSFVQRLLDRIVYVAGIFANSGQCVSIDVNIPVMITSGVTFRI